MNLKDYITEWVSSGRTPAKQEVFSVDMYLDEWLDTLKSMGYDILRDSRLGTNPDDKELVASLLTSFSSSGAKILEFWYGRRMFSFRFNGNGTISKHYEHSVSDVGNPNRCKLYYPESIVYILNSEIDKK